MRIYKDFHFDAAHWLPNVPEDHKCHRLHGHKYQVRVWCAGEFDARGFIVDYAEIDAAFRPVLEDLDHRLLNDVEGLTNPTTELLAVWIFARLRGLMPQLSAVEIRESATTGCFYEGD
ncbi:MAG: 6-carboxytetrahydropterin synthase QueD [Bryobacterales bacterium]|nr:6-carboxytetrahydropterin synthase QueD [Bryobacterales bacterium]